MRFGGQSDEPSVVFTISIIFLTICRKKSEEKKVFPTRRDVTRCAREVGKGRLWLADLVGLLEEIKGVCWDSRSLFPSC